jgi:hypothetical protein
MRPFFLTIPKPLKQHRLKKRPSIPLNETKADIQGFRKNTLRGLIYLKKVENTPCSYKILNPIEIKTTPPMVSA